MSWSTGATISTTKTKQVKQHLQYPSADKQVIVTFVLLVRLSFFVLHEIDQVLKGRLNGTRRAQYEKLIRRALLRLGRLKWNYYVLQIGNF